MQGQTRQVDSDFWLTVQEAIPSFLDYFLLALEQLLNVGSEKLVASIYVCSICLPSWPLAIA